VLWKTCSAADTVGQTTWAVEKGSIDLGLAEDVVEKKLIEVFRHSLRSYDPWHYCGRNDRSATGSTVWCHRPFTTRRRSARLP
jgi:hypothetical protein